MRTSAPPLALLAVFSVTFVACGAAKEKAIEQLKSQLDAFDLGALTKQIEAAPADVKGKVMGMVDELKAKKSEAMGLVEKLTGAATGDYAELLAKAKDKMAEVRGLWDKIEGMLPK